MTEPPEISNSAANTRSSVAPHMPAYRAQPYDELPEEQHWSNGALENYSLLSSSSSGSMSGVEANSDQQRYGEAMYLAMDALLQKARSDSQKHLDKIMPLPKATNYSPSICEDLAEHAQRTKSRISEIEILELRLKSQHFSQLIEDHRRINHNLSGTHASNFGVSHSDNADVALRCFKTVFKSRKGLAQPRWQDYVTIEQHLLAMIRQVEQSYDGNGFPATHIAYQNGDIKAMLKLWKHRPESRQYRDVLGRELPHFLVEANDMNTLGQLLKEDEVAVTRTGIDGRGLSLLALAAVAGELDIFNQLMHRHVAGLMTNDCSQFLLDLALVGGEKSIVEYIIPKERNYIFIVQPPYERATKKCIELGRADLAECFTRWLDQECWSDPDAIHELAELAKRKVAPKMPDLVGVLQDVLVKGGTRQEAIQDTLNAEQHIRKQPNAQLVVASPPSQPDNVNSRRSWAQVAACQNNPEPNSSSRQQPDFGRHSSVTAQFQARPPLTTQFESSHPPPFNHQNSGTGRPWTVNSPWAVRREGDINRRNAEH